ncbi:serine hydrolase [Rheinheimera texasensis]|uniref:serine hydrolase n=1 Tax=Rheinheimera texasensis TaxID=306205 RepID=UPI0032B188CF
MKRRQLYPWTLLSGLLLALSGCHDDANNTSKPNQTTVHGIWQKTGYGTVWQIEQNRLQIFNLNKFGCVRQADHPAAEVQTIRPQLQLTADGNTLSLAQDAGLFGQFQRLSQLPASCLQPMNGEQDSAKNFEFFWQDIQQYYAFTAERQLNWEQLYRDYQPKFANASLEQQQQYYQEIIARFGDAHVVLGSTEGPALQGYARRGLFAQIEADGAAGDSEALFSQLELYQQLLQQQTDALLLAPGLQATKATAALQYGLLPGGIGYLRINQLSGLNQADPTSLTPSVWLQFVKNDVETATAAMLELQPWLAQTKGLVIDLRFNQGGFDAVALQIVSQFNAEARVIGSKGLRTGSQQLIKLAAANTPYLKPLQVLAGGSTISAGEVMTLALKSLPQATIIGEPTHGSLSDALLHQLPNGWTLTLSNERYQDPAGQLQEVQGVLPDVPVYPYLSLDAALQSDTALDRALQLLQAPAAQTASAAEVQNSMRRFRQQFNQPGISAAVVRQGKVMATFAEGLADVASNTVMTADTPTLVASISKTLLGTAIAKLNIAVDNPLPALPFLPQRPDGQNFNPSWLQLAQHRSGIVDQDSTLFCAIYSTADGSSLLDQLRGTDQCGTPEPSHLHFLAGYLQPGGRWYQSANFGAAGVENYSNVGAELASLALEQHTAEPFADWSGREILTPLQLQNTFWPTKDFRNAATLYLPTPDGGLMPLPRYASSDYYDGMLHSSARDLGTYLAAIASDTPALSLPGLSQPRRQQLLGWDQPFTPGHDFPGWFWQRSGDYVGHNGLFVGASSMMYYNKATETGFVLLLNGDGQYWVAPDEAKSQAWQQAMLQIAARLYRHGLGL